MVSLVVGRIGRAHGLRGEVSVHLRTDDPEARFAPGATLLTEPAQRGPLRVAQARWHSGRLVVGFEAVDDRTGAEALRGTLLVVEVDDLEVPADPEEFYDHQLVGLAVLDVAGRRLGTVSEVMHLPGQDVLAVARTGGGEALIPFVAEFVPKIDLGARSVFVTPPQGLLELDGPG